jgi:hypothetical protein
VCFARSLVPPLVIAVTKLAEVGLSAISNGLNPAPIGERVLLLSDGGCEVVNHTLLQVNPPSVVRSTLCPDSAQAEAVETGCGGIDGARLGWSCCQLRPPFSERDNTCRRLLGE